ncbi:uncharacterized protein EI97DRAFT_457981 [Westerdykella ornata]|uniref:Uncharacterized protein n=1 Tax=Westerdykella ornata TaxID=318751 RepID=A0A6A6JKI4_WESOR|nr:uncharacterized protein EI97DRAFT_457981 [Westerdykella ornata]KAF2276623.1 hypothetical protein EI97DRAFT_457981 [Westerdykella ornata]
MPPNPTTQNNENTMPERAIASTDAEVEELSDRMYIDNLRSLALHIYHALESIIWDHHMLDDGLQNYLEIFQEMGHCSGDELTTATPAGVQDTAPYPCPHILRILRPTVLNLLSYMMHLADKLDSAASLCAKDAWTGFGDEVFDAATKMRNSARKKQNLVKQCAAEIEEIVQKMKQRGDF